MRVPRPGGDQTRPFVLEQAEYGFSKQETQPQRGFGACDMSDGNV